MYEVYSYKGHYKRRTGADHQGLQSTIEERRAYIKSRFPCIADCDMCGLCTVFRGKDAEQAYDERRSFWDVSEDYKRRFIQRRTLRVCEIPVAMYLHQSNHVTMKQCG